MMAFSLTRDTLMQSGILASDIRALYAHYSFSPTFSQDQMVKLIENLMHEYAYKNSLTNSVGGPVCIAKVNIDNTVTFIQNDFRKYRVKNFTQLVNDIINNKRTVYPVSNICKEDVISSLKKNSNYHGQK